MKKLTVREYAIEKKISETAVRKQINRNQLRTTHEIINNRKTLLIVMDNSSEPGLEQTFKESQHGSEPIKDIEIINDATGFQMVSMEQSSFDSLIQSFKEVSSNQVEMVEGIIKSTQTELFETRAELKILQEENKKLILETAEYVTNSKICELKNTELITEVKNLNAKINELENYNTILKNEISELKVELNNLKSNDLNKNESKFFRKF
ncbi:MAG: hypothetical protein AB1782_00125 [Cyanobacteriota bacterium]